MEADDIIEKLKFKSLEVRDSEEFVSDDKTFIESNLMRDVYQNALASDKSYIFSDNFEYCGLYSVKSKEAFEKVFEIAFTNQTCFLLDEELGYFFRINYYDSNHKDFPNCFDIKRSF